MTPLTVQCSYSKIILSNKLFHFYYKSLNATRKKIMFLWNFCHIFPALFYHWSTSINDSFQFFRVFSRNHFLERGFIFQWGKGMWCFLDGGTSFLSEGARHWRASVLMGGSRKKNCRMGKRVCPSMPPPPQLWETLQITKGL